MTRAAGRGRRQRAEPASRWSLRGSALGSFALGVAALLVLFIVALIALSGCPAPPPISGCATGTTRCAPDGRRPEACSSERRWFSVSDEPCSSAGADVVCCLTESAYAASGAAPLHACVPRERCRPEPAAAPGDDGSPPGESPASARGVP